MNQNDQILISLYESALAKDSYSIIKEYGQSLDLRSFADLVIKQNKNIDPRQIEIFFREILLHYKAEKISIFILDQLIRAGGKLSSNNERVVAQRAPHQIMSNINKTLKQKNLTVERIFNIFDQDKDQILNDKEFKTFLNYYFPTLKPQEYDEIKKNYQNQLVTQHNLTYWLQDGSALQNSMKIAEPKLQQKVIQQQAPAQLKVEVPNKQINKILESNIFEDNERSDILTSNINFETVIIMDYNIPNVDKFVQIYNRLVKTKDKFIDSEFPAIQKSIGPELPYYDWKKISQIWNDADIFKKDTSTQSRVGLGKWIAPSDIKQGELGDCYFLSTLSSIACRWPDTIRSLFLTQKQNPQNIYCVKLCIDGKWQGIIIDDFIPIKYEQPAFTKSDDHSMWVMLLEKAYAKVFGSYYNIQSGISTEVMRALTGCTTFTLKTDQEDFDQQFFGSLQRKCILTSGSKSAERGLIPKHAYSILKFIKDTHPQLGQLTLLKLRNPWGQKEWNGDWSDDSKLWTEQLKTKCKLKAKNDGTFFMSLNDFKKHFDQVSVGYYNKDFHYQSQPFIIKKRNSLYFKFDLDRDGGEYNIVVYQQSARHHKDKVDYQYSSTRLTLAQQNKQEYVLEDQKCKAENEVSIGGLLDGGSYILQVKVEWKYWNEQEIIVSQYGEKPIKLKQIKKIDFIRNTLLQFARSKSKLIPLDDNMKYSEYMKLTIGLGFQYFINQSNKTFKLTSRFSKFEGLKLKKPFRGNQFEIILKPIQDEIVIMKISPSGFNKQQNFEWISI